MWIEVEFWLIIANEVIANEVIVILLCFDAVGLSLIYCMYLLRI